MFIKITRVPFALCALLLGTVLFGAAAPAAHAAPATQDTLTILADGFVDVAGGSDPDCPACNGEYDDEDLIQREDMVVTVTRSGYIKRVPLSAYRAQKRGGKGRSGMATRDEDFVK